MTHKRQIKLVREGEYVAEVEIELIDTGDGWSPYISLQDAQKSWMTCGRLCGEGISRQQVSFPMCSISPPSLHKVKFSAICRRHRSEALQSSLSRGIKSSAAERPGMSRAGHRVGSHAVVRRHYLNHPLEAS